ncbi:band 4.1-like protein 4A [Caerostris darwini]|uniref:Band 4.1-like protein 4A n=1 Tax=Caerostris darwini TaxID=1538125 RepID=A0AAV4PRN5_9ARAC|nr:band 4.1-like protein 4A [Caerostris darwini]
MERGVGEEAEREWERHSRGDAGKRRMGCCARRAKTFHCTVVLLDETEITEDVQAVSKGDVLLERVFSHLNLIEKAYFGLRFLNKAGESRWLDPLQKVSTQLKGLSPFTLYFGVKFYASDPCRLLEEITRYQFVLQLKQDILQGRLPLADDLASELFALSLQAELGDFDPRKHHEQYVSEFRFLPDQSPSLEKKVEQIHKTLVGRVPSTVEMSFLERVRWLDMYGVDLHPVLGDDHVEYFLGLTPSGVLVMKGKTILNHYFWPRISKVFFKGKSFMIRVKDKTNEETTYVFLASSREACEYLWKCCVEHHAFFRIYSWLEHGLLPEDALRLHFFVFSLLISLEWAHSCFLVFNESFERGASSRGMGTKSIALTSYYRFTYLMWKRQFL